MKNQYFGDFGDYQKFSLLKNLRGIGGFKVLVHWMKTHDDGKTDGKHIAYLDKPLIWESYDTEIFNFIKRNIKAKKRNLAIYEESSYANGFVFMNNNIENPKIRFKLLDKIRNDKKSNLVFFDPDNGIEVKTTNSKNLHKYVLWKDVETAFNADKSVLIYQHFPRRNRNLFIQEKLTEFEGRFGADVFAIKVKYSVYFLLTHKFHLIKIHRSLVEYAKIWKRFVSVRDPRA